MIVTSAAVKDPRPAIPNAERHYDITHENLPLHCPMDGMSLWNSHPRVYLALGADGAAVCPYCGATYRLVD